MANIDIQNFQAIPACHKQFVVLMDDLVSTKACDNIEVRVLLARFNGWVFLTAPSGEKSTIDLAAGDVQDAKHSITARSSVRRWTGSMAGIA